MNNLCVLGFDNLVQDSKGKSEVALQKIPGIEDAIRKAQQMTTNAKEALAGADDHTHAAEVLQSAEGTKEVHSIINVNYAHHILRFSNIIKDILILGG